MADTENIRLVIDGNEVQAPRGATVLRAAELNRIAIPTLCSHKDLSPYGGCRMCVVEIDGVRGYPLACTTEAREGMRVTTTNTALLEIRREVLQLILSEHPSSCLICTEDCEPAMSTMRKAGVATGCRTCSNDGRCELQELVERLDIHEIGYPVRYRGLEPHRDDPFFDRDYNLCILCGRCVRMCQEMRGTGVLAFNWRGARAVVGPAFDRTHVEAGCEFCGACVSVCPTGALTEKAARWDGRPDGSVTSTCPYCAIGCQLELTHREGRFSNALPVDDPAVNHGQACVKGRFCIGELSHHFSRSRKPLHRQHDRAGEVSWDRALSAAAEAIRGVQPHEVAVVVSPDLSNEALYLAQKLGRVAVGAPVVDCLARPDLGGDLGLWEHLFRQPLALERIAQSSRIVAVGADTRFDFSVVGVEIRKALHDGARMVTVDPRESNLARYAHHWLRPLPGTEAEALLALAPEIDPPQRQALARAANLGDPTAARELLHEGPPEVVTVVVGPAFFQQGSADMRARALRAWSRHDHVQVLPLYHGANTRGALEWGAFSGTLPRTGADSDAEARAVLERTWGVSLDPETEPFRVTDLLADRVRPRVLYLVGAVPFTERPPCETVVVQDLFAPPFAADLFLPAASSLESGGTLTNVEGRVQAFRPVEAPPDSVQWGRVRSDAWILGRLGRALGATGFTAETLEEVQAEMATVGDRFPAPGTGDRRRRPFSGASQSATAPSEAAAERPAAERLLVREPSSYAHRGVDLVSKVEGLRLLDPESGVGVAVEDARQLELSEGDPVAVEGEGFRFEGPARILRALPAGMVTVYRSPAAGGRRGLAHGIPPSTGDQNPLGVRLVRTGGEPR